MFTDIDIVDQQLVRNVAVELDNGEIIYMVVPFNQTTEITSECVDKNVQNCSDLDKYTNSLSSTITSFQNEVSEVFTVGVVTHNQSQIDTATRVATNDCFTSNKYPINEDIVSENEKYQISVDAEFPNKIISFKDDDVQSHEIIYNNDEETNDNGLRTKRKRNPDKWKKTVKKCLRNSGCAYETNTGKIVRAKSVQPFPHHCRYDCDDFSEEERQEIFVNY